MSDRGRWEAEDTFSCAREKESERKCRSGWSAACPGVLKGTLCCGVCETASREISYGRGQSTWTTSEQGLSGPPDGNVRSEQIVEIQIRVFAPCLAPRLAFSLQHQSAVRWLPEARQPQHGLVGERGECGCCSVLRGSFMMVHGAFYCADGHVDVLQAVFEHVEDAEYR